MFGRSKVRLKASADNKLLELIEQVRGRIARLKEMRSDFPEQDAQLKRQLAKEQALFNFLYHQARVRRVSSQQVATMAAQRLNQLND